MAEYDAAIALALRLITKKGRKDGQLVQSGPGAPPADQPWKPGAPGIVVKATDLPVLILDAKVALAGSSRGAAMIASLAPEATAVAYVAAASLAERPKKGQRLSTRGERYSVLDVETLAPGDQDVLHILHLKA